MIFMTNENLKEDEDYGASSIQVLDDRDSVRKRP